MKRSTLTGAALAGVALVAPMLIGPGAEAATNPIQITYIRYDAPGRDTATNTSVNGEVVRITNKGTTARYISGWTLRDLQGHVYKFPTTRLNAGKSILVYTGKGTNTVSARFWGLGYHVWNNTGDKAILRTNTGVLADTCAWTSVGVGYRYC